MVSVLFALLTALCNGLASVLQRMAASTAPAASALRLSLFSYLIKRKVWLAGIGLVVLAACALLGIDEVHAVGGAQAVAMFAYGTEACRPTDLVMGPGNVYVASAKRLLRGVVGIDSEAGPTEIGILADDTSRGVQAGLSKGVAGVYPQFA